MIWYVVMGILLVISICGFRFVKNDELKQASCYVPIVGIILMSIFLLIIYFDWECKVERFKTVPLIIENKVEKIYMIKNSYKKIEKDIKKVNVNVDVDVVNQNLTQRVTEELKDLEIYINDINIEIANWKVKRRFRFWNHCHVKPPIELIKLSQLHKETTK